MTDRRELRRRLQELAFRQAGYVSAAQALRVGYSYQAQKYHVDRGNWLRVDRALFRLPGWPASADDTYARWTVWSDGQGVISFQSAAAVHGLLPADSEKVHLTLATSRARASGVVLHWGRLDEADIETRGGYRVTTAIRTVVDLAGGDLTVGFLIAAVDSALTSGQISEGELRTRMTVEGPSATRRLQRALTSALQNSA